MLNILVTVCARGGSKGVKGKNIRLLLGKPLIAHTIEQALRWGKAKRVVVSTDSEEIASVARECGAEVPFMRPAEFATDTASKAHAIKHALVTTQNHFRERYDVVVDLDVTAPVRKIADLDNCLKIFERDKPKTLFSVITAHKNPYFNMVEDIDGQIAMCKKLTRPVVRRQDAPQVYSMNASIYFYRADYVLSAEAPAPVSDDNGIYIMDELSGVDIDGEVDFLWIEYLASKGMVDLHGA